MDQDQEYVDLILKAVRISAAYKPMFGQGRKGGLTLERFQQLYSSDLFYAWFGLDSPLVYAAHRVSGGMASQSHLPGSIRSERSGCYMVI